MNIFYLSHDVEECARWHVDRHVVKMPTEYAQLLSTAHRLLDGTVHQTYSDNRRRVKRWSHPDSKKEQLLHVATHVNHPSAVWVRQSKANYDWLYSLFVALCDEYSYRYGKTYKAFREDLGEMLREPPKNIAIREFTAPTPAMHDEFIVRGNSITSYHNYYKYGKKHLHSWKFRDTPEWI